MDWVVKKGYIQPYKKGVHLWFDGKTQWLIWNITGTATVPRPIKDDEWKYHVTDIRLDTLKKDFWEAVRNVKEELQKQSSGMVPGDGEWVWLYDGNNLEKNQSRK